MPDAKSSSSSSSATVTDAQTNNGTTPVPPKAATTAAKRACVDLESGDVTVDDEDTRPTTVVIETLVEPKKTTTTTYVVANVELPEDFDKMVAACRVWRIKPMKSDELDATNDLVDDWRTWAEEFYDDNHTTGRALRNNGTVERLPYTDCRLVMFTTTTVI